MGSIRGQTTPWRMHSSSITNKRLMKKKKKLKKKSDAVEIEGRVPRSPGPTSLHQPATSSGHTGPLEIQPQGSVRFGLVLSPTATRDEVECPGARILFSAWWAGIGSPVQRA